MRERVSKPYDVLRVALGGAILCGGLFKALFYPMALVEYARLGLPSMLILPMMLFEVTDGLLLLLDKKARVAGMALVVFAAAATLLAVIRLWGTIASRASELFVLVAAPKDALLYAFIGLMAVVMLMLHRRRQ